MYDSTPVPVRLVGKGKPGEESRGWTTASDSDNPIHFRLHGMASAGAGGMLHPSMCDWSPGLYKTEIAWNQSRDGHPSDSEDPSSSRLVDGVHTRHPPYAKNDLVDMHDGSPKTPPAGSHFPVDSSQEPKSSLVIGGPGVESRSETPRPASGDTYTSQPKLDGSYLYQQKSVLVLGSTVGEALDSRTLGADIALGFEESFPPAEIGVREGQPDEPCGVLNPGMCDWPPEPYKTGVPWNQSRDRELATDSGHPILLLESNINNTKTCPMEETCGGLVPTWGGRVVSAQPWAGGQKNKALGAFPSEWMPPWCSLADGRGYGGSALGDGDPGAGSPKPPLESALSPEYLPPCLAANSLGHRVEELMSHFFQGREQHPLQDLQDVAEELNAIVGSR